MALVQTTDPATVRATLKERPDAIRPDLARQAARRAHDRRGFYADDVLGAKVSLSGSLGAEDGQVLLLGLDLACDADRTAGDRRTLPQRRADVLVQWAREAAARLSGPGDTLARDAHTVRTHLLITCTPDQLTGRISTGSSSTALGSTGSGAGRSSCAGARTGNGTTGSGTTGSDTGSGAGSGSASASGSGESAGASGPSSTAPHPRRPQDLPGLPGDGLPRPASFPTPGALLIPDACAAWPSTPPSPSSPPTPTAPSSPSVGPPAPSPAPSAELSSSATAPASSAAAPADPPSARPTTSSTGPTAVPPTSTT